MNFKDIIPNEDIRYKISGLLDIIPDKWLVKFMYRFKMGRKLNLKTPQRYSEKIQWYKLFYRNPLMRICVDKFKVRKYVKEKGLSHILNELYGVYDSPEDIDFDKLPNEFIIKLTSGSGGNIIVTDKNEMNKKEIITQLNYWMKNRPGSVAGEWAYSNDHKIIVEKLLKKDKKNNLPDYKFFCFDGKVEFLYVMIEDGDEPEDKNCTLYSPSFEKLPVKRTELEPLDFEMEKPVSFDKMVEYAEHLSKDFPHVRVDFYHSDEGVVTFGELTFYNGSGFVSFTPDEFDIKLGEKFILPN